MSFSARGCSIKGMSMQEIEQRFTELEAQIEEFRETVNNAEFWIQKLELNPEIVALRKAVQEQDQKIAELKNAIDIRSSFIARLYKRIGLNDKEIIQLWEDIHGLQEWKDRQCLRYPQGGGGE